MGKAKPDISDTDSVAVIKKSYQGRSLFGLSNRQKNWEKIPESRFFDLTVVFLKELRNYKDIDFVV